jgi:hypothetical protein
MIHDLSLKSNTNLDAEDPTNFRAIFVTLKDSNFVYLLRL